MNVTSHFLQIQITEYINISTYIVHKFKSLNKHNKLSKALLNQHKLWNPNTTLLDFKNQLKTNNETKIKNKFIIFSKKFLREMFYEL